jgi:rhodanese-related sulfurtransferase
MKIAHILASVLMAGSVANGFAADTSDEFYDPEHPAVGITETLPFVDVQHAGKPVRILRKQDPNNRIADAYARTSRECPPFCIQAGSLHPAVETVQELEVLDYLKRASAGEDVMVIDSRTLEWRSHGTIPGSVGIPWIQLSLGKTAPQKVAELLQFDFGVTKQGELYDFSNAKTLVFFCNGAWCSQSPANIKNLLKLGYPPERLKWYRGGMQAWESLGLTTVTE